MTKLQKYDGGQMAVSDSGAMRPRTFDEAVRFAGMIAKSQFAPQAFRDKPSDVLIAMQMGSELGLAPMQALQNIAVINGRPSVWGDAVLGLVRSHPDCDDVQESIEGSGDKAVAVCVIKRRGNSPVTARFSVDDAKRAKLWGKQGPWQQYPKRMLQMRARGFAVRDAFPDALRGLITAEEARDIPQDRPQPQASTVAAAIDASFEEAHDDGAEALELIASAESLDALEDVAEQLKQRNLNGSRARVVAAYKRRKAALQAQQAEAANDAPDYDYGPEPWESEAHE